MTNERAYFGDIHNHCNISYAHGSLADAIANARQRLDFCSITGHAHWPDMPEPNERTQHIIDFHEHGFARLKRNWPDTLAALRSATETGRFVAFPGFEVHSSRDGDRAVVYRDPDGELLYPESIPDLDSRLEDVMDGGAPVLALPHHIGYHQGARGINWERFNARVSPVVEVYSMHGASETTEGPVPFLHSMGPADWRSTVQYGLNRGHMFGFVANTDHHSAHPGSYGHGITGVWASELSRTGLWNAIFARRTYAMTGDKMILDYSLGGTPMGGVREPGMATGLQAQITGGAPIDYVDVVHNGRTVRRVSAPEMRPSNDHAVAGYSGHSPRMRTKLFLEVGWGPRGKEVTWEGALGISQGAVHSVDARFRGPDVLSPKDSDDDSSTGTETAAYSSWERSTHRSVQFRTRTYGNPTTSTPGTQGICLEIEAPPETRVWTELNGVRSQTTLERLMAGGRSGHLRHEIDSPAWLLHRAPQEWEYVWRLVLDDFTPDMERGDYVYLRVRQQNNQWAWGSPVFVR
jgi:hypothetical protein